MGATDFSTRERGETAADAFHTARENAKYHHGHGGYTGTIAEKDDFVLIPVPTGIAVRTFVDWIWGFDLSDDATNAQVPAEHQSAVRAAALAATDKWGPAGCVQLGEHEWLFFGYASD